MRHRCDSRIINYLTLMTLKTPEMTGTKLKFRSKFRFWLDSVPATGRNFAGISNLDTIDDDSGESLTLEEPSIVVSAVFVET
jgi:hypothetical protein